MSVKKTVFLALSLMGLGPAYSKQLNYYEYVILGYPIVSGNYALLSLAQPYNPYVLLDDQTDSQTRIVPPAGSGCQLWANAFGVPWLLFYCNDGTTLYNIDTRRWTPFPCGDACENTGTAAPAAIGSHWVEIDENAYCDPRYDSWNLPDEFVGVPSGKAGSYTSSSHTSSAVAGSVAHINAERTHSERGRGPTAPGDRQTRLHRNRSPSRRRS